MATEPRTAFTNLTAAIDAMVDHMQAQVPPEPVNMSGVEDRLHANGQTSASVLAAAQAQNQKLDALLTALNAIATKLDALATSTDAVTAAVKAGSTKAASDTLLITGKLDTMLAKPFWVTKSAGTISIIL